MESKYNVMKIYLHCSPCHVWNIWRCDTFWKAFGHNIWPYKGHYFLQQ